MDQQVLRVKVDQGPFGEIIRATMPIAAGEAVFYLSGEIVTVPSKYTIQLDESRHVLTLDSDWQRMNHGCAPNVRIDVENRQMVAIRDIASGEELNFNYNTTEWSMTSPFECGCGAPSCAGEIRGFKYLTEAQRETVADWVSPFINRRWHEAREHGAAGPASFDIRSLRPQVHVLVPYEIVGGNIQSPEYETPAFREELNGWFKPLGLDWIWHKVTLENVAEIVDTLNVLRAKREIVVFNLCDGSEVDGYPGISVIDALVGAGLPFTGASAEFYVNTTSKIASKKLLFATGVPTAPFVVIRDDERDLARAAEEVGFPFIIKPDISAGSYGIQKDSVCYDLESARRKVAELRKDRYIATGDLFVEKFISGREFTLFAVEEWNQPLGLWVLPPCERVFHKNVPKAERYLIYERYWGLPEAERAVPEGEAYYWYASAPEELRREIETVARRAIRGVGGAGYARVDMRYEEASGQVYVLEVNAQCGLSDSDDATVGSMLKLAGVPISQVMEKILQHGFNR